MTLTTPASSGTLIVAQSSTGNPGIWWRSLKILKQPGGNCGLYDFSGLDKILKYKYEFEYVTLMDLRERPAMR
jgi:hypothetical protein